MQMFFGTATPAAAFAISKRVAHATICGRSSIISASDTLHAVRRAFGGTLGWSRVATWVVTLAATWAVTHMSTHLPCDDGVVLQLLASKKHQLQQPWAEWANPDPSTGGSVSVQILVGGTFRYEDV